MDMWDSFAKEITTEVKGSLKRQARSSRNSPTIYVNMSREAVIEQLVLDYFYDNPIYKIRRYLVEDSKWEGPFSSVSYMH